MKMNPETTQAWEKCKIHWDKLADGDQDEPIGGESCDFCYRFSTAQCTEPLTHERCPIYRATGLRSCLDSGYVAAEWEHENDSEDTSAREAMRDFIYALVNLEEQPV